MTKYYFLLSMALLFTLANYAQHKYNAEITTKELSNHLKVLASDSLRGRYPGDKGSILSQEYIVTQLEKYGLSSKFNKGLQTFIVVTNRSLGDQNNLIVDGESLVVDTDFSPIAFSENTSLEGSVAFVGYGFDIDKDSLIWND